MEIYGISRLAYIFCLVSLLISKYSVCLCTGRPRCEEEEKTLGASDLAREAGGGGDGRKCEPTT